MKKCPKCGRKFEDGKFCDECGAELIGDGAVCQNCGAKLLRDTAFCPKCGAKIEAGPVCDKCRATLSADDKFCPVCGAKVINSVDDIDLDNLKNCRLEELARYEEKTHDFRIQYALACRHLEDAHDTEDPERAKIWKSEAFRLFSSAAEKGSVESLFFLGYCYSNEIGVNKDDFKAVEYYKKAAEKGFAPAQRNLGAFYVFGSGGLPKDLHMAFELKRKAAEQGNASAQCNVGDCYACGKGVPQDWNKAIEWYQKAAEQEYTPALYELVNLYKNGKGVPKDMDKANEYKQKIKEIDDNKTLLSWKWTIEKVLQ